jgi:hypothetical protein
MTAADLIHDLRGRGAVLAAVADRIHVMPPEVLTPADVVALKAAKPEVMALLRTELIEDPDEAIPEWTDEPAAKGVALIHSPEADGRLPYLRREQVLALDDEALTRRLHDALGRVYELDRAGDESQERQSLHRELRLVSDYRPAVWLDYMRDGLGGPLR